MLASMKIQFLGTAAAEGIPAFFCACKHCEYARRVGGKEKRTRSGALIDDVLKIDFCPDTLHHIYAYDLNFSRLEHVLVTHSHGDHFAPHDLATRRKGFSHPPLGTLPLTVYGNEQVCAEMDQYKVPDIRTRRLIPFETIQIRDYRVTPLPAVHMVGSGEQPLIYLIEKDGKSLLYAHDTDMLPEKNLDFLAGRHIGLITMDCTNAVKHFDYVGHMGMSDNLLLRDKLIKNGAADENTVFVVNHFSHNGMAPYEELVKAAEGMLVSYDGMVVEF